MEPPASPASPASPAPAAVPTPTRLSDAAPPPPASGALVRIATEPGRPALTKAQRAFNRWVARLDEQRSELATWRAFAESFDSRLAGELDPLQRRVDEQRLALLKRLDAGADGDGLTRREQARLAEVIRDFAADHLDRAEILDPEAIAIHDRHADVPYDAIRRGRAAALRAMAEERHGVVFPAASDLSTPEAVLDAARRWRARGRAGDERMLEAPDRATAEDDGDERVATRPPGAARDPRAAPTGVGGDGDDRPRSAAAEARRARVRAAADAATRSLRDVYRKLASVLHPDREPDADARARKTALMQRVNTAYDARDLLRLLALQVEAEQVDPGRFADLADARLEHYNRVLREQSETLARELAALLARFAGMLGAKRRRAPTPQAIEDVLRQELAWLRDESRQLTQDLAAFRDPRVLKGWLSSLKIRRADRIDPFQGLEALLEEALEDAAEAGDGRDGPGRSR